MKWMRNAIGTLNVGEAVDVRHPKQQTSMESNVAMKASLLLELLSMAMDALTK